MRKSLLRMGAALALGLSAMIGTASADEEKVPLDQVPKAVMDAVKAKFPGAEMKEASKEVEDGKTSYEVSIKHGGNEMDVVLKPDGTIEAVEKKIEVSALPKAVADALKAKYPAGKLTMAEEITKGKDVTYEVVVEDGKKKAEVVLDPKGKILETEDKGEDEG